MPAVAFPANLEIFLNPRRVAVIGASREPGKPGRALFALADVLLRVAALGARHGERIQELDINPLVVFERGKGARAVDALIVRAQEEGSHGSQA